MLLPDTVPPRLYVLVGIVQVLPSVQVCPFTVVEGNASAPVGIAEAETVSEGVEVEFVTIGTSQYGQLPEGAAKFVTVPLPVMPICT
jgi:hypothetical protein